MQLEEFLQEAIKDRLEGWELVEFLQLPIEDILLAALDNDWINEDNVEEVLDFVGINNAS
jgi:hypothetical protein